MADGEAKARVDVWKYAFGFNIIQVVKCAIELEIPDVLESRGSPMTLSELSTTLGCPQSSLFRIMRFLTHHGIFKLQDQQHYVQTPLSRLLTRKNMAPFVLLQAHPPAPWSQIIAKNLKKGTGEVAKESFSEDIWNVEVDDALVKLFVDSMACHARLATSAIIDNYGDHGFKGIRTLVDVGGNTGMAIGMLVKAFPWIQGINFDLPNVVSEALPIDGVEHVGGNMFESVPKADAVLLMWILHDWSDDSCIDILKKCKEAVPSESGKLMIVEAVIDEEGEGDEYTGARLALDMVMMAGTVKGKERTAKEWGHLLKMAGFSRHTIINIHAIESVIEAYP